EAREGEEARQDDPRRGGGPRPPGSSARLRRQGRRLMRLHPLTPGRVQGVWFRGATQDEARRRGVRGWVRNRVDGSVEAVLEGDAAAVRTVADWARTGPPGARVRDVVEQQEPEGDALVGFEIRH